MFEASFTSFDNNSEHIFSGTIDELVDYTLKYYSEFAYDDIIEKYPVLKSILSKDNNSFSQNFNDLQFQFATASPSGEVLDRLDNTKQNNTTYNESDVQIKYIEELKIKIATYQESGDYKTAAELKTQYDIISLICSIEPSQREKFIEEKLAEFEKLGDYETRANWLQAHAILELKHVKSIK